MPGAARTLSRPATAGATLRTTGRSIDETYREADGRVSLLEDQRRALLETTDVTLRQNREHIESLTKTNRELRDSLLAINRAQRPNAGISAKTTRRPATAAAPGSRAAQTSRAGSRDEAGSVPIPSGPAVEVTRMEVKRLKKVLDSEQDRRKKAQSSVLKLEEQMDLMHREIDRPEPCVEAALKRVRDLENRYDEMQVKESEALSVQNTYRAILERLRAEKVYFNTEIEQSKQELSAAEADHEQLKVYYSEAEAATSLVEGELLELKEACGTNRKARVESLALLRRSVEEAAEEEKRAEKARKENLAREEEEAAAAAAMAVQHPQEPEDSDDSELSNARSASNASTSYDGVAEIRRRHKRARLDCFVAAMRKITDTNGALALPDFVQKAVAQAETQASLQKAVDAFSAQLSESIKQISELRVQHGDAQFSADTSGSRHEVDKVELLIAEEMYKSRATQQKFSEAMTVLGKLVRGVNHLAEALALVRAADAGEGEKALSGSTGPADSADLGEAVALGFSAAPFALPQETAVPIPQKATAGESARLFVQKAQELRLKVRGLDSAVGFLERSLAGSTSASLGGSAVDGAGSAVAKSGSGEPTRPSSGLGLSALSTFRGKTLTVSMREQATRLEDEEDLLDVFDPEQVEIEAVPGAAVVDLPEVGQRREAAFGFDNQAPADDRAVSAQRESMKRKAEAYAEKIRREREKY